MASSAEDSGRPDREGKKRLFLPTDFARVIDKTPSSCPLVGGQAVAWWVHVFKVPTEKPVTSGDIDFWGFRDDVKALSKALGAKPIWPHPYEMTVWVGGIPLTINNEHTIVDFISSIPGLDVIYPEKASVGQKYSAAGVTKELLVLSPVSLVLAKLHALKAFDQRDRQDELHLRVSLVASEGFLCRLLEQGEIRNVLWNVERLLSASQYQRNQKLERRLGFRIRSAVPIPRIEAAAADRALPEEDRRRLARFLTLRWAGLVVATP